MVTILIRKREPCGRFPFFMPCRQEVRGALVKHVSSFASHRASVWLPTACPSGASRLLPEEHQSSASPHQFRPSQAAHTSFPPCANLGAAPNPLAGAPEVEPSAPPATARRTSSRPPWRLGLLPAPHMPSTAQMESHSAENSSLPPPTGQPRGPDFPASAHRQGTTPLPQGRFRPAPAPAPGGGEGGPGLRRSQ